MMYFSKETQALAWLCEEKKRNFVYWYKIISNPQKVQKLLQKLTLTLHSTKIHYPDTNIYWFNIEYGFAYYLTNILVHC